MIQSFSSEQLFLKYAGIADDMEEWELVWSIRIDNMNAVG